MAPVSVPHASRSFLRRIWNYNKSRIHSYRGARFLEISLDDCLIFRGEVAKAPGILNGSEASAEGVLMMLLSRLVLELLPS